MDIEYGFGSNGSVAVDIVGVADAMAECAEGGDAEACETRDQYFKSDRCFEYAEESLFDCQYTNEEKEYSTGVPGWNRCGEPADSDAARSVEKRTNGCGHLWDK